MKLVMSKFDECFVWNRWTEERGNSNIAQGEMDLQHFQRDLNNRQQSQHVALSIWVRLCVSRRGEVTFSAWVCLCEKRLVRCRWLLRVYTRAVWTVRPSSHVPFIIGYYAMCITVLSKAIFIQRRLGSVEIRQRFCFGLLECSVGNTLRVMSCTVCYYLRYHSTGLIRVSRIFEAMSLRHAVMFGINMSAEKRWKEFTEQ